MEVKRHIQYVLNQLLTFISFKLEYKKKPFTCGLAGNCQHVKRRWSNVAIMIFFEKLRCNLVWNIVYCLFKASSGLCFNNYFVRRSWKSIHVFSKVSESKSYFYLKFYCYRKHFILKLLIDWYFLEEKIEDIKHWLSLVIGKKNYSILLFLFRNVNLQYMS